MEPMNTVLRRPRWQLLLGRKEDRVQNTRRFYDQQDSGEGRVGLGVGWGPEVQIGSWAESDWSDTRCLGSKTEDTPLRFVQVQAGRQQEAEMNVSLNVTPSAWLASPTIPALPLGSRQ